MTVRRLETVHRLRYFRFCNVLHIWTIRAIPTYRVGIYTDQGKFMYLYVYNCKTIISYLYANHPRRNVHQPSPLISIILVYPRFSLTATASCCW